MPTPAKGPANPPSQNTRPRLHPTADSPEELYALTRLMARVGERTRVPAPPQPFPVRRVEPAELPPLELDRNPAMYPLEVNQDGTTRHSQYCRRTPSRYDWQCVRCCELLKGANPRQWHTNYLNRKLRSPQRSFIFEEQ